MGVVGEPVLDTRHLRTGVGPKENPSGLVQGTGRLETLLTGAQPKISIDRTVGCPARL